MMDARAVAPAPQLDRDWTENTSDEDIVLGAQVLTDAIVDVLQS